MNKWKKETILMSTTALKKVSTSITTIRWGRMKQPNVYNQLGVAAPTAKTLSIVNDKTKGGNSYSTNLKKTVMSNV